MKSLINLLNEKEELKPEEFEVLEALEAAKHAKIRVKFGWNLYTQTFICSHCREQFENTPDKFVLWLRLEVFEAVMDFPICPRCVETYALFETDVMIRNNPSHHIGTA